MTKKYYIWWLFQTYKLKEIISVSLEIWAHMWIASIVELSRRNQINMLRRFISYKFLCLWNICSYDRESVIDGDKRPIKIMVLILDGNSDIGAHVLSTTCNLLCLRHFFRSRSVGNLKFISEKTRFSSYMRNMSLSYHLMLVPWKIFFYYSYRKIQNSLSLS